MKTLLILLALIVGAARADEPEAVLLRNIRTLQRPVVVYHYGKMGKGAYRGGRCPKGGCDEIISLKPGPVNLDDPEALRYFKAMSSQYAESKMMGWAVGGGLYAAIDPLQSASFGDTPWFLLEITIPAGTRYLDTRDEGISLVRSAYADPKFHGEFVRLLKKHGIGLFAYVWDPSTFQQCIPEDVNQLMNQRAAFNFVDPALANDLRIRIYSEVLETEPTPDKGARYEEMLMKMLARDWIISPGGELERGARPTKYNAFARDAAKQVPRWIQVLSIRDPDERQLRTSLDAIVRETFGCEPNHPEEWIHP